MKTVTLFPKTTPSTVFPFVKEHQSFTPLGISLEVRALVGILY